MGTAETTHVRSHEGTQGALQPRPAQPESRQPTRLLRFPPPVPARILPSCFRKHPTTRGIRSPPRQEGHTWQLACRPSLTSRGTTRDESASSSTRRREPSMPPALQRYEGGLLLQSQHPLRDATGLSSGAF